VSPAAGPGGQPPAEPSLSPERSLEVTGLDCFYGSQQVVWDVSLALALGDGVAIVGRNGVGKTTVLRGIANAFGVHRTGRVQLDGTDVSGWRADRIARAGLGFVPDDRRILPLSVRDNLRLGARAASGWKTTAEQVLDYFPLLKDRLDQRGDTMSGGEQQAVAIARALMAGPRYLLLDEPAEGLAPALISQLIDALTALRRDTSIGIVLVDRNIDLISRLCSTVFGMSKGRMLHRASAADFAADESLRVRFLAPVSEDILPTEARA
jgi:branched-chain amino acid transport system ATP-binding protein